MYFLSVSFNNQLSSGVAGPCATVSYFLGSGCNAVLTGLSSFDVHSLVIFLQISFA